MRKIAAAYSWNKLLFFDITVCPGVALAGLVFFITSAKKVRLYPGEHEMPMGKTLRTIFGNIGMILFVISIVVLFILNVIP